MRVDHVPCGEFANASESLAIGGLISKLRSLPGTDRWILLSNVASSVSSNHTPDELDLIAIGPNGLFAVEIKHWDKAYLRANAVVASSESTKLNDKIRRLVSRIRKAGIDVGFVAGRFLLTKEDQPWKQNRPVHNGSRFYVHGEWRQLLDLDQGKALDDRQVEALVKAIQPLTAVTLTGQVRRLGNARNLELLSPSDERFHRLFRGEHARLRDKIILHLFDLSASPESNPEVVASREYDALHRLQQFNCVPRVLDSYQEVPDYPGELYYFSLVDPCAPSMDARAKDLTWGLSERCDFAVKSCQALEQLHSVELNNVHFMHRNLSPQSLLVTHDGQPLFTDFRWSRSTASATVAHAWRVDERVERFIAPEIREYGLGRADQRSDVFALCASLTTLFECHSDSVGEEVRLILAEGMAVEPAKRLTLGELVSMLTQCISPQDSEPALLELPPARYWSEGLKIPFKDQHLRLVSSLGSGSFGSTFKVVELFDGDQEGSSFVGKVVFDREAGERALKAYRRIRAYTTGSHLAAVFEVASGWKENGLLTLMKWVNGSPVDNLRGLLELYAEELGEGHVSQLVGRWITDMCQALRELHSAGLVHGDVSAKNILEASGNVFLVDYDLVVQAGEAIWSVGTPMFAPPEAVIGAPASMSHDLFSLAATFFHVAFDRPPFMHGGKLLHAQGLNWSDIEKGSWGWVADFMDKATSANPELRFASSHDALTWIANRSGEGVETPHERVTVQERSDSEQPMSPAPPVGPQQVPWLAHLLATYPGSPRGSTESRGLDSEFASNTYVETALEDKILKEVQRRETQLVILCGNAGDGKTAFLQHLAARLGLPPRQSAERVWDARLADGLRVVINLDGAASFKERSSDQLLDEVFRPFHQGRTSERCVHLVAVNDGRLLQWAEDYEERHGSSTHLTQWLYETLTNESVEPAAHIRLIGLNERSLVGTFKGGDEKPSTEFLDQLLDRLLGGDRAPEIWRPCQSCSSAGRCTAFNSVRVLTSKDERHVERRERVRERLGEALQAVHHRGQVHITTRELRGALTYIFFGTDYCDDLHANPELVPDGYWDRAFEPLAPLRQGEVLGELKRFDPALESHPLIDRYLRSSLPMDDESSPPRYPGLKVPSARRRAYFEWSEKHITSVASLPHALSLAKGEYVRLFARVPVMSREERQSLCAKLCGGISRLEHLPRVVLTRSGVVPLKVQPRTPVETTFWIEKDLERFDLSPVQPTSDHDLEWLHNALSLTYRYKESDRVETLLLSSDLFSSLLGLSEGFQLMDTSTDDVFSRLSIFTQRLAEEDECEVYAFEPGHELELFHIRSTTIDGVRQLRMTSSPIRDMEPSNG